MHNFEFNHENVSEEDYVSFVLLHDSSNKSMYLHSFTKKSLYIYMWWYTRLKKNITNIFRVCSKKTSVLRAFIKKFKNKILS